MRGKKLGLERHRGKGRHHLAVPVVPRWAGGGTRMELGPPLAKQGDDVVIQYARAADVTQRATVGRVFACCRGSIR